MNTGILKLSAQNHKICPLCGSKCDTKERICWKCGSSLEGQPVLKNKSEDKSSINTSLIHFEEENAEIISITPTQEEDSGIAPLPTGDFSYDPHSQLKLEKEAKPLPASKISSANTPERAAPKIVAEIGGEAIKARDSQPLMRLTFCKHCGFQNEEGDAECRKCSKPLEIVPIGSIEEKIKPSRNWFIDLLAAIWIIVGVSAVLSRIFLIKTNTGNASITLSDFMWTGIVASIPGILVFLRHFFCRLLFWTMSIVALLVWSVVFILWFTGHLLLSDNGRIGLGWIAVTTALTLISYFVVRQNDAFDSD
jgi:ribosomal protein L40E